MTKDKKLLDKFGIGEGGVSRSRQAFKTTPVEQFIREGTEANQEQQFDTLLVHLNKMIHDLRKDGWTINPIIRQYEGPGLFFGAELVRPSSEAEVNLDAG